MSKNVFIDCGAHNGCSVKHFFKNFKDAHLYEIHSFECNPKLFRQLQSNTSQLSNVNIHNSAVWVKDGVIDFYLGVDAGSSLMKSKRTGQLNLSSPLAVDCIDLSRFIIDNFDIDDNIILKLDIEGAEYDVIRHLQTTGALKYIKQLHGEWHWHKIGYKRSQHDEVVNILKNSSLVMIDWNAL